MLLSTQFHTYEPAIRSLPVDRALTQADLLTEEFLMERHGQLETYYAPHNEYVNLSAKIVIIGITPGWTQMRIAMQEARKGLEKGLADEEIGKRAKEEARFAGSMKHHLISLLNALQLHKHLNLPSCEELFGEHRELLHSTSLLPYPVFFHKKNYTGSRPNLLSTPSLLEAARLHMAEELRLLGQILIIPLGKTVESVLRLLEREGKLDGRQCLWGFPHPSGANGHRHKQFKGAEGQMRQILQQAVF
ncbi:uracil-DNA glycosylase family protein [Paenibacillus solisilvae]|uniref:Uracil-DNA glycosylase family protein n=1 Tax=Paenibacillus solisilvae TaxID=2486751 RepID=A0ABW0W7X6_9BACL